MKNTSGKGENNMSIAQLRDVVSHFSEELRLKAESKQDVTVAGKLIEVNQLSEDLHVITLDDYVGTTRVLLSHETYVHFQSILKIDSFISVQGYVNKVSREVQRKKETQVSVVGYNVQVLMF
jgi:DNA polymerase II small subunit/DNA polymerase delta subunit B